MKRTLLDTDFYNRGDVLLTSHLVLGEVSVGAKADPQKLRIIRETIEDFGFTFLPFELSGVQNFTHLRYVNRLNPADSIKLAAAAAAGVDLFLTNDGDILKKTHPHSRYPLYRRLLIAYLVTGETAIWTRWSPFCGSLLPLKCR